MPPSISTAKEIFLLAVEKTDPADRDRYLCEACGTDAALRRHVEALLRVHDEPDSLLDQERIDARVMVDCEDAFRPTLHQPPPEQPGAQIGPYKLLQQIGEGGMGVVFMAEQTEPVKRRVALKIIKPGMDTRQVIARFEAERQALALMDHPNIARVLDAGTTAAGRPYFVMELVKGQPITQYCDEKQLTPRQRLELLLPVCQAIQHAHQKGIIHRDIKPTNILVAEYDQQPVPKVIDFGVAKAISQALTEMTMFTGLGQIVGTLEYMSPEQAKVNQLDIDTRSDIYSLGVLLYELLTGTTPFDKERLRSAAWDEMLRIIREEEPPKPSTRLSDSHDSLPSISAQRHTEPAKLTKLVRGELDWIVMKALEKDRNRRYETANGFAADVQRYLNDEQVEACPPTSWYRFRKFSRRNKRALATASLLGVMLLAAVGTVAGVIGWVARDRAARHAATGREVDLALNEAARLQNAGKWPEAKALAKRAEALLENGGGGENLHRRVRQLLADLKMVAELEDIRLRQADVKDERFDTRGAAAAYARAFQEYGVDVQAMEPQDAADRLRSRSIHVELAAALDTWARRRHLGRADEKSWKDLLAVARRVDPDERRNQLRNALERDDTTALAELAALDRIAAWPAPTLVLFGEVLASTGSTEKAVVLLRQGQQEHPADFWINHELAFYLHQMQPPRLDEAINFYTAARALRPESAGVHVNLGRALADQGNLDEAIVACKKAIRLKPDYATAYNNLGAALQKKRDLNGAVDAYREAIRRQPDVDWFYKNLGGALRDRGDLDEAIAACEQAIRLNRKNAQAHVVLGLALLGKGALDKAIAAYSEAIRLDPQDALAHSNLGNALRQKGDQAGAIAACEKAIALNPDLAEAHTSLGNALHDKGDLAGAVAAFNQAIRLEPALALAHFNLGNALRQKGDQAGAIAAYQNAIALQPDLAGAHNNLGVVLRRTGDLAGAIAACQTAIGLQPDLAEAHTSLGSALSDKGDQAGAIAAHQKAIALKPDLAGAHSNLGIAFSKNGDLPRAIAAFQKAVALNPDDAQGHYNVGNALGRNGNLTGAVAALEKALALKPDYVKVHNHLARLLTTCPDMNLRDPVRAFELAKKAVELDSKSATSWQMLGWAHYRMGDWKASIQELKKSIELQEDDDAGQSFFLAMAHWQLGDTEQARNWYEQAIVWMEKNEPQDEELKRFRAEAAALLKIPEAANEKDVTRME